MKTYLDCIPCLVRQALDAARLVTDDERIHEQVIREVLHLAVKTDLHDRPPVIGHKVHRLIKQLTNTNDPYRDTKRQSNEMAMRVYPELKAQVRASEHPLETAIRLAIAGNIMDFGVNSLFSETDLRRAIAECLVAEFDLNDLQAFQDAVGQAESMLYIADNAGEIVFDRLLIEQLPVEHVTLVVKGAPVLNDATVEDARVVGLTEIVDVVENGSDAPGTILETCSLHFRDLFTATDLVVAKGQANYETLSQIDKNVFFLLKAKCPVIARDLGCDVGKMILCRSTAFTGRNSSIVGGKTDAAI